MLLTEWAKNPSDLTLLGAAADEAEEDGANWPLVFALRWMALNAKFPGSRKVVRKPWTWVFDLKLHRDDSFHRQIRRSLPNSVLPTEFYPKYPPHFVSFPTPVAAVLWLAAVLDRGRRLYGYAPRDMPSVPYSK